MNKICMICSHCCSGSDFLYSAMNDHPRIQGYFNGTYNYYENPQSLLNLTSNDHKLSNRAAVYMDHILFNYQISTKNIYKNCDFIYVIREPYYVLHEMVLKLKYKPEHALNYYSYRLRRICEMAKKTPNGLLLLWEDLISGRASEMVSTYMSLDDKIDFNPELLKNSLCESNISLAKEIDKAEKKYEKYIFWIKNNTSVKYWGKDEKI